MKLMKKLGAALLVTSLSLMVAACGGGGGSSDSGIVFTGTLIQSGDAAHALEAFPRHSAGEPIENVEICALGACSVTDGKGQWGFEAGSGFAGGDVAFLVNGHGIATNSVVNIPSGAGEVEIDFQHKGDGVVHADHVTIDGVTQHLEEEDHAHEE